MSLYDIIKKPVITEASMLAMDARKYTFDVDVRANKTLVKQAVEASFEGVKVQKVNVMNVKPRAKRVGKYSGFTKKRRKAIVTLTADSKAIEIFENE
ncbi:MAG: 50S ribosomal protein L23 [Streptococcaceae bacterium]|jgi:large subunit ribosomal protein L23|nr:50S ribosomal protein L23 [Streptococcaceae bacterium]